MDKPLTGKVAFVTGSSTGIGRAIAERLAAKGTAVALNYLRGADRANEGVRTIENAGGRAIAVQANMSDTAAIRRFFDEAEAKLGRPDIIVANAGIAIYKPLIEATEHDYDETFALNSRGTFFCLQEAARRVGDGGRIIAISSSATHMSAAGASFYSGSKAAVEQFVLSLAKEIGSRNVTVNAVSPGLTDTDMLVEDYREAGAKMSPFGRIGRPQDVADIVAFLASEEARWLTGQNLQAGGGVVSHA